MPSAHIHRADDASGTPHTVWRTPHGVPCFSSPSTLGSLWRRGRRLVARLKRALG